MRKAKTASLLFDRLLFERVFVKLVDAAREDNSITYSVTIDRSEFEARLERGDKVAEYDTFDYFEDAPPGHNQAHFNGLPEALARLGADWFSEVWPTGPWLGVTESPSDEKSGHPQTDLTDLAAYNQLLMERHGATAIFSGGDRVPAPAEVGTGEIAVAIAVPDIGQAPWDAIAAFRSHPGSQEARARFRQWELEASSGVVDLTTFQVQVAQAITRDLMAAAAESMPSTGQQVAGQAANTAIGLIPMVGSVAAPALGLADVLQGARRRRKSWFSALVDLASR